MGFGSYGRNGRDGYDSVGGKWYEDYIYDDIFNICWSILEVYE